MKYLILSPLNCNHFNCRIRQLKGKQLLKCSNCETAVFKFTYLLFPYAGYNCAKCGNVSKFCGNMNFACWKWSQSKLNFWTWRVSLMIHVNYWEGRGTVGKNGSPCILWKTLKIYSWISWIKSSTISGNLLGTSSFFKICSRFDMYTSLYNEKGD